MTSNFYTDTNQFNYLLSWMLVPVGSVCTQPSGFPNVYIAISSHCVWCGAWKKHLLQSNSGGNSPKHSRHLPNVIKNVNNNKWECQQHILCEMDTLQNRERKSQYIHYSFRIALVNSQSPVNTMNRLWMCPPIITCRTRSKQAETMLTGQFHNFVIGSLNTLDQEFS